MEKKISFLCAEDEGFEELSKLPATNVSFFIAQKYSHHYTRTETIRDNLIITQLDHFNKGL